MFKKHKYYIKSCRQIFIFRVEDKRLREHGQTVRKREMTKETNRRTEPLKMDPALLKCKLRSSMIMNFKYCAKNLMSIARKVCISPYIIFCAAMYCPTKFESCIIIVAILPLIPLQLIS